MKEMENAVLRLVGIEGGGFRSQTAVFNFLREYHGIMITPQIRALFPADEDGETYATALVGNIIIAAHAPSSSVWVMAWRPSPNEFADDVEEVRRRIPKLKMYRNWHYFISNLPEAHEPLPNVEHTFQYGYLEWPTEPVDPSPSPQYLPYDQGPNGYEASQDPWYLYEDDDNRMFQSEELEWGESSEELPGPDNNN